jgi:mono/diheme cytochrome c family protein
MTSLRLTAIWIGAAAVCLMVLAAAGDAGARRERPQGRSAAPAADGRELFRTYCASCHGASGVGNGPAAAAMRRRPADLTGLALANNGVFPSERMRRIIDGREIEAHGDRDMPVWGDAFKSMPGGRSDEAVRARIAAILQYLASIQRQHA